MKEMLVQYKKWALKFIKKNQHRYPKKKIDALLILAVKKILLNSNVWVDVLALKWEKELWRIRSWDVRIVFSMDKEGNIVVLSVEHIDRRWNIYK